MIKTDIRQRKLRENKGRGLPRRMLFFDTEAKTRIQGRETHLRTKLAVTCYINFHSGTKKPKETWHSFRDTFSFCRYIHDLARPKSVLWCFAHNAFYDLQASDVFYYLPLWGWNLQFTYDSGLTYLLVIEREKAVIKFVSTTNYFDLSLKELGRMTACEKLEVDFEGVSEEELETYCRRDVEIVKRAVLEFVSFVRENDLGNFSLTRAGQALNAFRHRFMKTPIRYHDDPEVRALERDCYFGGRTECFRFGEQKRDRYVTLDINSMYPFLMKTRKYPFRCLEYREGCTLKQLERVLVNYGVCIDCDIETEEPAYAYRDGLKIIFPVGRFRTGLCTEGARYALERGHIKKIHRIAVYEMCNLFSDFVDFFYQKRLEYKKLEQPAKARLCKIMLNSLYGKFAQKRRREVKEYDPTGPGYYSVETFDFGSEEKWLEYKLFNIKIQEFGEEDCAKTLIAISAHVTEYARMLLWSLIQQLGTERVYYCDTDSLKIREQDMLLLDYPFSPTELGALKVEDWFTRFEIYGPKNYRCDEKVRLKGVPRSAREIAPDVYEYDQWNRQRTHMRKKVARYFIVEKVQKVVVPYYDKGVINPDNTISPFRLGSDGSRAALPGRLSPADALIQAERPWLF